MRAGLQQLVELFPNVLKSVRGLGMMLGVELVDKSQLVAFANSDKTASLQFVNRLHEAGVLTIPSGAQITRLLPPLNLTPAEAEEGLGLIEKVVRQLSACGSPNPAVPLAESAISVR